ncbi:MAG: hypothetical protein J2P21_22610, partial [Chloracidobacterium sp.]|nr:hypothetical protein [Chloracidobacterium sp.]
PRRVREKLLANNYAAAVMEVMTRRWYYKMRRYLIKEIADWYYSFGLAAETYERYQRASKRFYAAWHLVPEMKEAASVSIEHDEHTKRRWSR